MKQIVLKKNCLSRLAGESFLEQYLHSLGITQTDSFINKPSEADEGDPEALCNMKKAVSAAYSLLSGGVEVYVQPDPDCDGFTSSAIIINYLQRRFPNCKLTWELHSGKEHGIIMSAVPHTAQLVIIPDAGSNQFTEQKQLCAEGKTVIVLDHHEVEDINEFAASPAIIVNNQVSPDYPNKSLSGAGVAYKFIKEMDRLYFTDSIYHDYGDLAAIGIIADAMNMTTLDNNYLAYWGLSHIHNKFIQMLAAKQARGIKNPDHLTKIDVAFYIAPVINGVIRSGTPEDKQAVFEALITNDDDNFYDHTWRGVTKQETRWERAVRMAINAKGRQDSLKRKSFEFLCEKIRAEHLDEHNLILVSLTQKEGIKVSANITGLIAMELVKEFNKPVVVVRQTELDGQSVLGGSGRNGNFRGLTDLKAELEAANVFYAAGHANAMGVFIKPDQIDEVVSYFDSHLDTSSFSEPIYEVDYWYHTGDYFDTEMLMTMAEHDHLWGNGIPQPKFAFDINYDASDVKIMGADKTSLKLRSQGVDFVSFKNPELIKQLTEQSSGHITLVGRPQINEWMGHKTIQVVIDDAAISDAAATRGLSAADLI